MFIIQLAIFPTQGGFGRYVLLNNSMAAKGPLTKWDTFNFVLIKASQLYI